MRTASWRHAGRRRSTYLLWRHSLWPYSLWPYSLWRYSLWRYSLWRYSLRRRAPWQALLVKLGGASQGVPEQAYTDRFPEKATADRI